MSHRWSWKSLLKRNSAGRGMAAAKHSGDFVPLFVERLEDRRVLSGASAVLVGDLLLIEGGTAPDPVDDVISISVDTLGAPHERIVVDLGSTTEVFDSKDVAAIQVRLLDGNDLLTLAIPSETKQPLMITVDGNDGDDAVVLADRGPHTGHSDRVAIVAESIRFQDPEFHLEAGNLTLQGTLELSADHRLILGGDLILDGNVRGPNHALQISAAGKIVATGELGTTGNELGDIELKATAISLNDLDSVGDVTLNSSLVTLSGDLTGRSVTLTGLLEIDGHASISATDGLLDLHESPITGGAGDFLTLSGAGGVTLASVLGLERLEVAAGSGPGSMTILEGDITAIDAAIFADPVLLQGDVAITSMHGDIQILGGIDSLVFGGSSLSLQTLGITGDILLGGNIGENSPLADLAVQTAGGTIRLCGDLSALGTMSFAGVVLLCSDVSLTSQSQNILFGGRVSSEPGRYWELTATADKGTVRFGEAVGSFFAGELGGLTVADARRAQFLGTVELQGPLKVTAGEADVFAPVVAAGTDGSATFDIRHRLTVHAGAAVRLDGSFTQSGPGLVFLGGNITTRRSDVSFESGVVLTESVAIDTTPGESLIKSGNIRFGSFVTGSTMGGQDLELFAGQGSVEVQGSVGETRLGQWEIHSARDVEVTGNVAVESLIQRSGSGMTTFHAGIDASRSDGIRLTGTRFRFEGPVSATSGGGMTIWNSGLVEITADADFVLDGPFFQRGAGPVLTAGNITTTGDSILFQGPVRLADGAHVTLNTTAMGGSGADIRFAGTLNGQTAGTAALTLSAGGGDVRFERVVGQSQRLGTMTVVDAQNVLIAAALHADSLTQVQGTGTTLIDGPIALHGAAGLRLATENIVQNAAIDVASAGAGGEVRLAAVEDIRLNAEMRSGTGEVAIAADRDVLFSAAGRIRSASGEVRITADADGENNGSGGRIGMSDGSVVDAGTGTIAFSADGDITLGSLATLNGTGDAIRLISASAGIVDGGDQHPDLIANRPGAVVTIFAVSGIGESNPLETRIASMVGLNSGSGDIRIDEQDSVRIRSLATRDGAIILQTGGDAIVDSLETKQTDDGTNSVRITVVAGDLTIGVIDAGMQNDVELNVAGRVLNDGDPLTCIHADQLLIQTGSGIDVDTEIAALNAAVNGSGDLRVRERSDVVLANVETADGMIDVTAGGKLTALRVVSANLSNDDGHDITLAGFALEIGRIEAAGQADILLTANLGDIDDQEGDSLLIADQLSFRSAGGFGATNAIATAVTELLDGESTRPGAIRLNERDDLTVTRLINADGAIAITAGGMLTAWNITALGGSDGDDITLAASAIELGRLTAAGQADILLTATLGDIDDQEGDSLLIADQLSFRSAGGFGATNAVATAVRELLDGESNGPGVIRVDELDDLTVTRLINADGAIMVTAGGTVTALNIASLGGTDNDDIALAAAALRLGRVAAVGLGDVALLAAEGNVTDVSPGESPNVTADRLAIRAMTGVGLGTLGDADDVDLSVTLLAAETDSGEIHLANDRSLTIGIVDGLAGLTIHRLSPDSTGTGTLTLFSQGILTFDAEVRHLGGADVRLVSAADLVLNKAGHVTTGSGSIVLAAGGNPWSGLPDDGTISLADGNVVTGQGSIDLVAGRDIRIGRLVTTGSVGIVSVRGGVFDAGDVGGVDIQAAGLTVSTAKGIGSGNPIETAVATLAVANTNLGSDSIRIENSAHPTLIIGSVTGTFTGTLSGIVHAGSSPGGIAIGNRGAIEVNTAVINESGGGITLTARNTPADADNLVLNAPLEAAGPLGKILLTAAEKVILTDTAAAADVHGHTVTIDAGTELIWPAGVFVRSFNGSAAAATPLLKDFQTPQITTTGLGMALGDFGRTGEAGYIFIVTWDDGTIDTYYQHGTDTQIMSGPPDRVLPIDGRQAFAFSHIYTGPTDPDHPSAPIPIRITVTTADSLTFRVKQAEVDFIEDRSLAPNPGEGNNAVIAFDLSIEVPQLEAPKVILGEAIQESRPVAVDQTQTVDTAVSVEAEEAEDVRFVIIERIAADGTVDTDAEGRPLRLTVQGDEARKHLDNLDGLFRKLDSGRWRIYLKEGADGQSQLIRDVLLRSGKPAGGDAGTQDRPPTEEAPRQPGPQEPAMSLGPLTVPEFDAISGIRRDGASVSGEPVPGLPESVPAVVSLPVPAIESERVPVEMAAPVLLPILQGSWERIRVQLRSSVRALRNRWRVLR